MGYVNFLEGITIFFFKVFPAAFWDSKPLDPPLAPIGFMRGFCRFGKPFGSISNELSLSLSSQFLLAEELLPSDHLPIVLLAFEKHSVDFFDNCCRFVIFGYGCTWKGRR